MPNLEEIYKLVQDLNPPVKRIEVDLGGGIRFLRVEEIVYFTTDDKRLRFVTTSGQEMYNFSTLADMGRLLENNRNFFRSHRSFIVNLDHVDRVERKGTSFVIYFTGLLDETVPLTRDNLQLMSEYFTPSPE